MSFFLLRFSKLLFLFFFTLGCEASFSNRYLNKVGIDSETGDISARISLSEFYGTPAIYFGFRESENSDKRVRFLYVYEGYALRIFKKASLYCDSILLPIQNFERTTKKGLGLQRRVIIERVSGFLLEDSVDKLGNCKVVNLHLTGENESVSYFVDGDGMKLIAAFYKLVKKERPSEAKTKSLPEI